VRGIPSNEGVPRETRVSLKKSYFMCIGSFNIKRLQIGTYMLLIITSTGNELFRTINV